MNSKQQALRAPSADRKRDAAMVDAFMNAKGPVQAKSWNLPSSTKRTVEAGVDARPRGGSRDQSREPGFALQPRSVSELVLDPTSAAADAARAEDRKQQLRMWIEQKNAEKAKVRQSKSPDALPASKSAASTSARPTRAAAGDAGTSIIDRISSFSRQVPDGDAAGLSHLSQRDQQQMRDKQSPIFKQSQGSRPTSAPSTPHTARSPSTGLQGREYSAATASARPWGAGLPASPVSSPAPSSTRQQQQQQQQQQAAAAEEAARAKKTRAAEVFQNAAQTASSTNEALRPLHMQELQWRYLGASLQASLQQRQSKVLQLLAACAAANGQLLDAVTQLRCRQQDAEGERRAAECTQSQLPLLHQWNTEHQDAHESALDGSAAALRAALSHVPLVNNAQVGLDPHAPQAERLQQAMSVGLEVLRAAEARIAPLVSEPADDGSKQPPCIISRLEAAAQTLVTRQRGDVAVDPEPADSLRTASDGVSVLSALLRNVSREAAGLDSLVAALAQLSGLQAQAQSMRAQLVGLQQAQAAADAAASSVHLDWLTHVVAASEVPTPAAGLPH